MTNLRYTKFSPTQSFDNLTLSSDELSKSLAFIKSGTPDEDCYALYRWASTIPAEMSIVELGSWAGKSAVAMLFDTKAHVYMIDPWRSNTIYGSTKVPSKHIYATVQENVAEFTDAGLCTLLRGKSVSSAVISKIADMSKITPIGLLFIDSMHTGKDVAEECAVYLPMLRAGALLIFHDYREPFVEDGRPQDYSDYVQAINTLVLDTQEYEALEYTSRLLVLRKVTPTNPRKQ